MQTLQKFNTLWLRQAIKFGLVGVLNTAVDAGVYLLLTRTLGFFAARPVAAKAISYTVGVINSYVWNRTWTFRSQANPWRTFVPFYLSNLVGVGINAGVMSLGLNQLRLPEAFAFLLATAVTLAWNFLVSKFVVFRR
jgi:putative flippase GtrA